MYTYSQSQEREKEKKINEGKIKTLYVSFTAKVQIMCKLVCQS